MNAFSSEDQLNKMTSEHNYEWANDFSMKLHRDPCIVVLPFITTGLLN